MSSKITKRMMSSVDDMVSRASSATKRVSSHSVTQQQQCHNGSSPSYDTLNFFAALAGALAAISDCLWQCTLQPEGSGRLRMEIKCYLYLVLAYLWYEVSYIRRTAFELLLFAVCYLPCRYGRSYGLSKVTVSC